MWGTVITVAVVFFLVYSLLRPNADSILKNVKPSYTSREVADLAYRMKRDAGFLYLAYGIGLGALVVALFKG